MSGGVNLLQHLENRGREGFIPLFMALLLVFSWEWKQLPYRLPRLRASLSVGVLDANFFDDNVK
jgi:hypothetical protein